MTTEQQRILELEDKNLRLELINRALMSEVTELKALVAKLINEVETLKHSKNSRNSSVPPSKDENRPKKNQSLRTSSGKKPGGQQGHKGSTLLMTENPDTILDHKPCYCNHCGAGIAETSLVLKSRRQVLDIPPIRPHYTEHRSYQGTCSCGQTTIASFPAGVNSPISYGPNIESLVAYMHARQYIPYERAAEYFKDVHNVNISQASINNIIERFSLKASRAYELITEKVQNSLVVGGDETGTRINGRKGWFWGWQTPDLTYVVYDKNRGKSAIDTNFPLGFPNSVLIHDCWSSYFSTPAKSHQLCTSHLLRELNFFIERYKSIWAKDFRSIIHDALDLKRKLIPSQYNNPINQRTIIESKLDKLLHTYIPDKMKEVHTFQKRIVKYRDFLFSFLYHPWVPPDNNASERAIRNVKVKTKISGQFKSAEGAQRYAIIRSITDTCIKNSQPVLPAFLTIANHQPE
jgi:transposase